MGGWLGQDKCLQHTGVCAVCVSWWPVIRSRFHDTLGYVWCVWAGDQWSGTRFHHTLGYVWWVWAGDQWSGHGSMTHWGMCGVCELVTSDQVTVPWHTGVCAVCVSWWPVIRSRFYDTLWYVWCVWAGDQWSGHGSMIHLYGTQTVGH